MSYPAWPATCGRVRRFRCRLAAGCGAGTRPPSPSTRAAARPTRAPARCTRRRRQPGVAERLVFPLLEAGDFLAQLGGANGGDVPAGATPDDDQIEAVRHVGNDLRGWVGAELHG